MDGILKSIKTLVNCPILDAGLRIKERLQHKRFSSDSSEGQMITMNSRSCVAGIDGGASKTVAIIADTDGKILGKAKAGPSNYHNIGVQAATLAIQTALKRARHNAGTSERPAIAVVALAGIDSKSDMITASRFVKSSRIAQTSIVIHDSVAALYAATKGRPGIVVNAGTGSFAAGINRKGAYARAGGWGYIVSDEGSAYDIGLKAIKMAFRSFDGREKNTEVVTILKRRFRIKEIDDLVPHLYTTGLSVEQIAGLAPLVIKSARKDMISRSIIREAGTALGELVCTVATRLHMTKDKFPVAAIGGNFRSGDYLLRTLKFKINQVCPYARVIQTNVEPAVGSLSLALEALKKAD